VDKLASVQFKNALHLQSFFKM